MTARSGSLRLRRDRDEKSAAAERLLGALLGVGVLASLAIIVAGLVASFLHHPEYLRSTEALRHLTSPGAASPRTIGGVVAEMSAGRGRGVVSLGLLLLIAPPPFRVLASFLLFLAQRDRDFSVLTALVLALLVASFFLGAVG